MADERETAGAKRGILIEPDSDDILKRTLERSPLTTKSPLTLSTDGGGFRKRGHKRNADDMLGNLEELYAGLDEQMLNTQDGKAKLRYM